MIDLLFPHKRYSFINESLLQNLKLDVIQFIDDKKSIIKIKKRQVLFHEGTIPTGVFILKKGKVKQYVTGLNGKQHIFNLVKENEILGYHNLICEESYSHTSTCLTDCVFDFIPQKIFGNIIEENPVFKASLLKNISHDFGVFINNSRILAQHNVRERVALSIIKLDSFFNESGMIKLSRKDHSSLVGTSIESLVRVLYDFKKEEAIEIKEHTIVVKNMNKLVAATNFM